MEPQNSQNIVSVDQSTTLSVFTQSTLWVEFQTALGKKTYTFEGDGWHAVCIENKTPLGTYWLSPYGPYAENAASLKEAVNTLTTKAREEKVIWIRLEPRLVYDFNDFKNAVKAPKNINPGNTTMSDLRVSEEELYLRLGKTNRQRVNKQKRDANLKLWTSVNPEDISKFTDMQGKVSQRTGAVFYDPSYLKTQSQVLMPKGAMRLEFAGLKPGEPVAGCVIHDYNGVASYSYAASLPEARDLGAANVLIWQSMLNAKARGNKTFDFWGIAPPDAPENHPWQGFTAFKRSFGTRDVSFSGTWDIPLSPKYKIYRARTKTILKLKNIKRKLK